MIATHPDQALALLADPTPAEREVLGAFRYSLNEPILHTDSGLLPARRRVRASWNYALSSCTAADSSVRVSYDMTRLQRLAGAQTYVVTLNAAAAVAPEHVIARMSYAHPVYDPASVAAQRRLPELNDGLTAYAGRLPRLGLSRGRLPGRGGRGPVARGPLVTALYECAVRHVRTAPLRNAFTYRTYQWLVDLDALPRLPAWLRPLASFRSADHLGDAGRSIRENVDRFLAAARDRPGRRPDHHAGQRPRAGLRVQPAQRVLVP